MMPGHLRRRRAGHIHHRIHGTEHFGTERDGRSGALDTKFKKARHGFWQTQRESPTPKFAQGSEHERSNSGANSVAEI